MLTETRHRQRRASVDMSPLIDVVFLLLIFFAVTTTFLEQSGMDLELPESSTAPATTVEAIIVEISGGGEIRLDGEAVTADALEQRVAALDEDDRAKITVRADRSIDLGTWVRVIDALRKGGAEGISLPMVPLDQ
ncbi:MAG TPA: biopolymer transporter ExbD [Acidobacteriota bacterium]|nr:biopolymer transporter ExbD [Acidobacteriota bacterium]